MLLWCCATGALAENGGAHDPGWQQCVLQLRVNGAESAEDHVVLRDARGALWLAEDDFDRLRLRVPHVSAHIASGRRFLPIAAIPGATAVFDEPHSAATITVPAAAFEGTNVALTGAARPPVAASVTGAFLNYQLFGQTGRSTGVDLASAYAEIGVFSPLGLLTNAALVSTNPATRTVVRLETTFSHDFQQSLETLRVGDAISVPGSWGEAVRFGGLQWGTNYGIRPDLVTTPLLAATGSAVVPSTVDVFVNGKPVGSTNVPAGPFVVNQVPTLTGSGEVTIVVKSALGDEQVMHVPFYSAPVMLQPGLSLYNVDLGALRRGFGFSSADYGLPVATATWRHGFTAGLTGEVHAEAVRGGPRAAGVDLAQALDRWAVLTADLALGGEPASAGLPGSAARPSASGSYAALGIQHVDQRLSLLLQVQHASAGFRKVGDVSGQLMPLDRTIAQAGWSMGRAGSLQAALVAQRTAGDGHQEVVGLTYQLNLGLGSLSANLSRTAGDTRDSSVYLFYTFALDGRRNTSTMARYESHRVRANAALVETLQKSLPLGAGDGYQLSAGTDGSYNAEYQRQTGALLIDAAAARYGDMSAERLTVSGAVTLMGGNLRVTRTLTNSFAVVDAGGIAGLTVYLDNQAVARTDVSGSALVPNLRSFQVNQLGIDAVQLPLDATVTDARVAIVPAYRSGALVSMPVKRVRPGVFRLRRADGSAVPSGATVAFQGEEFPVGFDGFAYVTNYDHGTTGEARWTGGRCKFRLPPPPAGEPQPDLGVVPCVPTP